MESFNQLLRDAVASDPVLSEKIVVLPEKVEPKVEAVTEQPAVNKKQYKALPLKPEYPKFIQVRVASKEMEDEITGLIEGFLESKKKELEEKKRFIQKKLYITQLMIYALESGDFSDLPPSAVKELEEQIGHPLDQVTTILKTESTTPSSNPSDEISPSLPD